MNSKLSINLLQPELLPPNKVLTLNRVTVLWLFILLLMLTWWYSSSYQLTLVKSEVEQLTKQKEKSTKLLGKLEQEITRHKPDSLLQAKLDTMKLIIANKTALHARLTNGDGSYVSGFALAMTELSDFHSPDISLQHIKIAGEQITFKGVTRSPQAVPQWLAKFEQSSVLSGQVFSHFSLQEDEESQLHFVVSSSDAQQVTEQAEASHSVKKGSLLSLMGQK